MLARGCDRIAPLSEREVVLKVELRKKLRLAKPTNNTVAAPFVLVAAFALLKATSCSENNGPTGPVGNGNEHIDITTPASPRIIGFLIRRV